MRLYEKEKGKAFEALKEWFEYKDLRKWNKKYSNIVVKNEWVLQILSEQRKFCNNNSILYTPATIIDKYMYPREYEIDDLIK